MPHPSPPPGFEFPHGGSEHLYGAGAALILARAHCAVIGVGGVGSWAAEALIRTGLGRLTLIDLDDVCATNINRQIQTLPATVGQPKVGVMADRLRAINPSACIHAVQDFVTLTNLSGYVGPHFDAVIDATDATDTKAGLAAYCSARKIRLIMVGASGGKRDPTRVRVEDLGRVRFDPMLARVRAKLFDRYGFTRESRRKFRIDAVYSDEPMRYPQSDGQVSVHKSFKDRPAGQGGYCDAGFGSAVMVTGTFGFAAASRAVERILAQSH